MKSKKRFEELKITLPEKKPAAIFSQPVMSPSKKQKSLQVDETIVVKGQRGIELKINSKFFG